MHVEADASRAAITAGEHRAAERKKGKIHRRLSVRHSSPSPKTCSLLPNNLISTSIIHFCFQQVISEAARDRARRYGNHSSSWMKPSVVKVKSKRPVRAGSVPVQVKHLMEGSLGERQLSKPTLLLSHIKIIFKRVPLNFSPA